MSTNCAVQPTVFVENKRDQGLPGADDEGIKFFTGMVTGVLVSIPLWMAVAWIWLR